MNSCQLLDSDWWSSAGCNMSAIFIKKIWCELSVVKLLSSCNGWTFSTSHFPQQVLQSLEQLKKCSTGCGMPGRSSYCVPAAWPWSTSWPTLRTSPTEVSGPFLPSMPCTQSTRSCWSSSGCCSSYSCWRCSWEADQCQVYTCPHSDRCCCVSSPSSIRSSCSSCWLA